MNLFRRATSVCVALATPIALLAQAKAGDCNIDVNKLPAPAKTAYIMAIEGKGTGEAQKKQVRDAVAALAKEKTDPVAGNYVMARAVVWQWDAAGNPPTLTRGDVGFTDNPTAQFDVYAAADSAFNAMEQAQPVCKTVTNSLRTYVWAKTVNKVIPLLNTQVSGTDSTAYKAATDSASVLLKHAIQIQPSKPQTYFYYSYVDQRRADWASGAVSLQKAIDLASPAAVAADTSLKQVRREAMQGLGRAYQNLAVMSKDSATKRQAALKGAAAYKAYLAEYPTAEDAAHLQEVVTGLLEMSGDADAIAQIRADMLKNPTKYGDAELLQAGADAFTKDNTDKGHDLAAQYFTAALKVNPNSRDALFNLLNMQVSLKHYDEAIATGGKLLAIAPSDTITYHQIGYAYQELAKAAKDPKVKKMNTDSAVAYATKEKNLPSVVGVQSVDREANDFSVRGVLGNRTKTPKKMTAHFEFLDAQGNVVGSADAKCLSASAPGVCSLNAGGRDPFTVSITKPGIVAYRYTVQ